MYSLGHWVRFAAILLLCGATLSMSSAAGQPPAELIQMREFFTKSGWQARADETRDSWVLVLKDEDEPNYFFSFDKRRGGLRSPMLDPNMHPEICVMDDVRLHFFDTGYWSQMVPLATSLGLKDQAFDQLAVSAASQVRPQVARLAKPNVARKLTAAETVDVIHELRHSELALREIIEPTGQRRVENVPVDAKVIVAWGYKHLILLKLRDPKGKWLHFYPFVIHTGGDHLQVLSQSPEEARELPYLPSFQELLHLTRAARYDVDWNLSVRGNGQAGIWFRKRLSKPAKSIAWTWEERGRILETLEKQWKKVTGLVYAKCGNRAVAQFYADNHRLVFVEFTDDELSAILGVSEATARVESTKDTMLWQAYEGVCRQFGYYEIMAGLYANRGVAD